jgi:hypothetical protein
MWSVKTRPLPLAACDSGSLYSTFNVFDVGLDFDADTAPVEDEFGAGREERVSLQTFGRG